jgi:hypothetical protein
MNDTLDSALKRIEKERYVYTTKKGVKVFMQRMMHDSMWYAVYDNQIVIRGQYRHDIESWCDRVLNPLNQI